MIHYSRILLFTLLLAAVTVLGASLAAEAQQRSAPDPPFMPFTAEGNQPGGTGPATDGGEEVKGAAVERATWLPLVLTPITRWRSPAPANSWMLTSGASRYPAGAQILLAPRWF